MEQELNSLHGRCSGLQEALSRASQFGFTDDNGTPNLLAENKSMKEQVCALCKIVFVRLVNFKPLLSSD